MLVERRDALCVKLTDTQEQQAANQQNQQACSKTMLLLLAMTKLIFVCVVAGSLLLSVDSQAKKRKKLDPQSSLKKQGTSGDQGRGWASEVRFEQRHAIMQMRCICNDGVDLVCDSSAHERNLFQLIDCAIPSSIHTNLQHPT